MVFCMAPDQLQTAGGLQPCRGYGQSPCVGPQLSKPRPAGCEQSALQQRNSLSVRTCCGSESRGTLSTVCNLALQYGHICAGLPGCMAWHRVCKECTYG